MVSKLQLLLLILKITYQNIFSGLLLNLFYYEPIKSDNQKSGNLFNYYLFNIADTRPYFYVGYPKYIYYPNNIFY